MAISDNFHFDYNNKIIKWSVHENNELVTAADFGLPENENECHDIWEWYEYYIKWLEES